MAASLTFASIFDERHADGPNSKVPKHNNVLAFCEATWPREAVFVSPEVERTPDGHHIVVHGRKWRAADPEIPENLAAELVAELMAARRAVSQGRRAESEADVESARRRVSDAKTALGERGLAWWEPHTEASVLARSDATALALLRHRDATSSIRPSEVAKVVEFDNWRSVLPSVGRSLEELARLEQIQITRRSHIVASCIDGPVRVRRGPRFPDAPPPRT